jgi:hypothetical protein
MRITHEKEQCILLDDLCAVPGAKAMQSRYHTLLIARVL